MKIIIYLGGLYNLAFALFHIGFWKMLKWNEALEKLDLMNRAVMQTLNVHLIYYLFFVTFACIAFPVELMNTKLGNAFLLSCSLFWLLRIVNQFIFFETNGFVSVLSSVIMFGIGVVLFALPVFKK